MSDRVLHPEQFKMLRPSDLAQYAHDRSGRSAQAKVDVYARSIAKQGYRASQHDNPHRTSGWTADSHIHLHLTDHYPYTDLIEGNHRVAAMNQIGYDKPVPVRITDHRTSS